MKKGVGDAAVKELKPPISHLLQSPSSPKMTPGPSSGGEEVAARGAKGGVPLINLRRPTVPREDAHPL